MSSALFPNIHIKRQRNFKLSASGERNMFYQLLCLLAQLQVFHRNRVLNVKLLQCHMQIFVA